MKQKRKITSKKASKPEPKTEKYCVTFDNAIVRSLAAQAFLELPPTLPKMLTNARQQLTAETDPFEVHAVRFRTMTAYLARSLEGLNLNLDIPLDILLCLTGVLSLDLSLALASVEPQEWQADPRKCLATATESLVPTTFKAITGLVPFLLNYEKMEVFYDAITRLGGIAAQQDLSSEKLVGESCPPVVNKDVLSAFEENAPYIPSVVDGYRFAQIFVPRFTELIMLKGEMPTHTIKATIRHLSRDAQM